MKEKIFEPFKVKDIVFLAIISAVTLCTCAVMPLSLIHISTEDYLKTIYLLSQKTEVHGAYIAEALGVSKPTVSVSLKGLEKEGYLFLDDDHEVHLTRLGQKVAQATYGRHQTFQTLLENLGVDGKTAAAEDVYKRQQLNSKDGLDSN